MEEPMRRTITCTLRVLAAISLSVAACEDPAADDDGTTTTVAGEESGTEGGTEEADSEESSDETGTDGCDGAQSVMCPDGTCVDTGNFVPDEFPCCDHGGECGDQPPPMCDIWNPDDCPEGEKCNAYATMGSAWDANKCVMIMGDGQVGDDCMGFGANPGVSGEDSCDQGAMCWDIDPETQTGYCIDFCTGSAQTPSCEGDTLCAIFNEGVLPLCLATCDPLIAGADCPNPKNVCVEHPGSEGFVCVLDASGGMGTYGAECQYINACNQGLFCAAAEAVPGCVGSAGCCSEFCDLSDPAGDDQCSGVGQGQQCIPYFEEGAVPPGYENVGACAIPN
jgi:hypothetical protein